MPPSPSPNQRKVAAGISLALGIIFIMLWDSTIGSALGIILIGAAFLSVIDFIAFAILKITKTHRLIRVQDDTSDMMNELDQMLDNEKPVGKLCLVRVHENNRTALKDLLREYSGKTVNTVKLLSYTGDMGSRTLQENLEEFNVKIHHLKILLKSPSSMGETITVSTDNGANATSYPSFPLSPEGITNRRDEVQHTLTDLKSLIGPEKIESVHVRYYYGLPSVRVVLFNDERGFFSIYKKHTIRGDLSGATNLYFNLSKNLDSEQKLLKQIIGFFDIMWESSSESHP